MDTTSCIGQDGIVQEIFEGQAKVNIASVSACSACHSKSSCQMGDTTEKLIHVSILPNEFRVGDRVSVLMQKSLGLKAVVLAYVIPFSLLLVTLIILSGLGLGEVFSGLISLLILVPYFFILYLNRQLLHKTFKFILRKLN